MGMLRVASRSQLLVPPLTFRGRRPLLLMVTHRLVPWALVVRRLRLVRCLLGMVVRRVMLVRWVLASSMASKMRAVFPSARRLLEIVLRLNQLLPLVLRGVPQARQALGVVPLVPLSLRSLLSVCPIRMA